MNVNVSSKVFIGHLINGTLETTLCRICLKPFGEVCENIFTQFWFQNKILSVADILTSVCQAKFSEKDNYNVCSQCIGEAFSAYNFYLKYQFTTKLLEDYTKDLEECTSAISNDCVYIKHYQQVCVELKNRNIKKTDIDYDVKNFLSKAFEMCQGNSDTEKKMNDEVELQPKKDKKVNIIFLDKDIDSDLDPEELEEIVKSKKPRARRRGKKDSAKRRRRNPDLENFCLSRKPNKTCEICKVDYKSFFSLLNHRNRRHDQSYCDVCAAFYKKTELYWHLEIHSNVDVCCCDICKIIYQSRDNLVKHLEFHDRKYVCEICGNVMNRLDSYRSHMIVRHKRNRKYICKYCGKQYQGPTHYKVHIARHKVLLEHASKKVLTAKQQWKVLSEAEKNKKPRRICSECGADFVDDRALRLHVMRSHTGERPFTCQYCGRGHVSRNMLNQHIETTHQLPRHRCPLCPAVFRGRPLVSTHISKVHLTKDKRHTRVRRSQPEVTWPTTTVPFDKLRLEVQYRILEMARAGELTLPDEMMTETMKKLLNGQLGI